MLNERQVIAKWNEACNYCWTKEDLQRIVANTGTIYVYHGCPDDFADSIVSGGYHEYTVFGLAKYVCSKYGLPWSLYSKYANRAQFKETFHAMSTAPVLIAFRWASNFKYGEVLSDLNSHARVLRYILDNREVNKSISDQYDELYNKAIDIGRQPGKQYATTDSFPDLLNLEDRYSRSASTGAIIQVKVNISSIYEQTRHDAGMTLRSMGEEPIFADQTLMGYNDSYTDIHVSNANMIYKRVVIRGIPYRCTDFVRDMMVQHKIDDKGRII
jgi:hypothetical protein